MSGVRHRCRACLAQDHALAHKALEGLLSRNNPNVIQHLVPEARIEQMQHCMLRATCMSRAVVTLLC